MNLVNALKITSIGVLNALCLLYKLWVLVILTSYNQLIIPNFFQSSPYDTEIEHRYMHFSNMGKDERESHEIQGVKKVN